MTRRRILLWAGVGLVAGLALSLRIVSAITPPTSPYDILRTDTGLGDLAILLGSPVAYLLLPLVTGLSPSSIQTGYSRALMAAFVASIALNWALWAVLWSIILHKLAAHFRARAQHRRAAA